MVHKRFEKWEPIRAFTVNAFREKKTPLGICIMDQYHIHLF